MVALEEWAGRQIGSRRLVGLLTHSNAFAAFVNAAPGARELVAITKAWELGQRERWVKGTRGYDLVVLDGPASGHGVGMLRTPHTFAEIARVGPIATQARKVVALLEDPARSALVAVALPAELSVSETLDLEAARGRRGRAPARRRGRQRRACRGASARPTSIACCRATARSRRRWPRPRAASTGRPARSRASCAGCAATRAAHVTTLPYVAAPHLGLDEVRGAGRRAGAAAASATGSRAGAATAGARPRGA